jgi:hypothetical protein
LIVARADLPLPQKKIPRMNTYSQVIIVVGMTGDPHGSLRWRQYGRSAKALATSSWLRSKP